MPSAVGDADMMVDDEVKKWANASGRLLKYKNG
jgi:hypothetical protein